MDQVRPGGIVAFVTSRYTMDSKNPDARKYLAQRAELLGAIRLPNNAFRANAGTDVVSDIIFLQKRDHPIDIEPDWVHLGLTSEGITLNSYFVDHPEMVLGEITTESTQYGKEECTVIPIPDEAHRDMLALRSAAKKAFDAYKKENGSGKKLPHISELNAEYAMLLERKKSSYAEYRKTKSEMQDWLVAQKIVQEILKEDEQKKEQMHEQEVRQEEENRQSSR